MLVGKMYLCVRKSNVLGKVNFTRSYHSDGVFGYKPKPQTSYRVPQEVLKCRNQEGNFHRLVTAFRQHAHKNAAINPVALTKNECHYPELDAKYYGFSGNETVNFSGIIKHKNDSGTINEAIDFLREVYGKQMSAEFLHLENVEEREWFSGRMEANSNESISVKTKKAIAKELLKSQVFDNFLATNFPKLTRYNGEGAESMLAFFTEFLNLSATGGVEEIVVAMAHRGRLNLLSGLLKFPPAKMFTKLKGLPDFPSKYQGTGDVLNHSGSSVDLDIANKSVHVSLLYNPSHLEAVNAVSMGKTRAKLLSLKDGDYSDNETSIDRVLNLQVHGDAAFSGQGINQECLAITKVPHFEIGGSIHLIVNNQLGFTTPADRGRSTVYSSDLAKFISSPVIHVNGDYPELVVRATRLAFEYKRKFKKDIFLDLNCYRQWGMGNGEIDDPNITNPALYSIIRSKRTVPDQYADTLISDGILTKYDVDTIVNDHNDWLNQELKNYESYVPEDPCFQKQWTGFSQAENMITTSDTGISADLMQNIGTKSVTFPENFKIHPHLLKTFIKNRLSNMLQGDRIDWATAEAIAMGSLLYQGYNVRISGQDVGRGTFSHRHVMLVDQETNNIYIPLNSMLENQTGHLEVVNSILSELAVLGYEYGMSIESPNNLIIWEAQFGDFFNGAQTIIDTFISSGEAKWLWSSGIVMLLPHGYDGAGPEHSSSKIERFLQLTNSNEDKPDDDNVNMQVCQPSTPAQYFHLLRRQMLRNYRKPLIIIAPKTLLGLSAATSTFSDMAEGTSFIPVLGDQTVKPEDVKRVILTSGKHYYTLLDKRQSENITDTALIRLESFCPFPTVELRQEISKYRHANEIIWCQEEPRNMGAWTFIKLRFENLVGKRIIYCGRDTLSAPAVGVGIWHQEQVAEITSKPFASYI